MCEQSIISLAQQIRTGTISPTELTRHALDTAHKYNDHLNTFISIADDNALLRAQRLDRELVAGSVRGPLHGIPLAIKDNFFVAGEVTTMGSRIHSDFIPDHTATSVQRLLDAGAIPIGKTNMHEYALGATTTNPHYGACRNPWNREFIPGGSSGGSAVAVATGAVPGALGSDTSGSIRIPAAICGISGFKPTYGRTSRHGCFPEAWTLDTVGPLANYVQDLALMLDVISGADTSDRATLSEAGSDTARSLKRNVAGRIFGIVEDFYFHDVDPVIEHVVRRAIRQLEELGARVEPIEMRSLDDAEYALTIIDTVEATTVHHYWLTTQPHDYGDDVRTLLAAGALPSGVDYLRAQQVRAHIRSDFKDIFAQVDALVGPVLPVKTPRIGEDTTELNGRYVPVVENLIRLLGPANLVGLPSLSVPCGLIDDLPVGLQIMTAPGNEQMALDIAASYEIAEPPQRPFVESC